MEKTCHWKRVGGRLQSHELSSTVGRASPTTTTSVMATRMMVRAGKGAVYGGRLVRALLQTVQEMELARGDVEELTHCDCCSLPPTSTTSITTTPHLLLPSPNNSHNPHHRNPLTASIPHFRRRAYQRKPSISRPAPTRSLPPSCSAFGLQNI